jgi:hypothetical protein
MKFLIVQLPPFSRHLIPLRSKHTKKDEKEGNQNIQLKKERNIKDNEDTIATC